MNRIANDKLRRAFFQAVQASDRWANIPGLMGKPDNAGGYIYDVPGGQGLTWVRITTLSDEVVSTARAYNDGGVAENGTLPIWLKVDTEGKLSIVKERRKGV